MGMGMGMGTEDKGLKRTRQETCTHGVNKVL